MIDFKVRGFYYNPGKGLFLFRSDKSALDNIWTTPGGRIGKEDPIIGLGILIKDELGANAVVDQTPFYDFTYNNSKHGHKVNLRGYGIQIDVRKIRQGIDWFFADEVWLNLNRFRITSNNRMITRSKVYDEYVERLKNSKAF